MLNHRKRGKSLWTIGKPAKITDFLKIHYTNRMAERTKLWIAQVVKRLMQTKDVEKIRVTDIYAAAQIERATFYYHFRDKYDAIAWIFAQDAGETDILNEKDAARGLEKMREDFLFYKRAYEDSSETPLWRYMLEYFTARYSNLAKEKKRRNRTRRGNSL